MDGPTNDSQPRRSRRLQASSTNKSDANIRPRQIRRVPKAPKAASSSPQQATQNNESLNEDDLCPICQLLLYRPVTTTCDHTMCESCMAHWADVSISSQMDIVDVDEQPVAFNPVSELEAKCPMCRTQTNAKLNPTRMDNLAAAYPKTWAERKAEEEAEGAGNEGIQTLTVYIGNRHRIVEAKEQAPDGRSNQHEWTFFVKPSRTDIIEEVQILLHHTFRPNRIIRQRAPYEIQRLGWGVFSIIGYVILKAGYTWVSSDAEDSPDGVAKGMLPLNWTLDFDGYGGKGSMARCRLKVKNDREWQDVSDEEGRDNAEWQRNVRQYQRDGRYEPEE